MKTLVIATALVAGVATTIASAAIIVSKDKQSQLERAARLSTLSTLAVKNGDYELACRAQREVVDALYQAQVKAPDLIGTADKERVEFCQRAHVSALNETRFFTS